MEFLGCRAPALTQAGEKGLEPSASDLQPVVTADTKNLSLECLLSVVVGIPAEVKQPWQNAV